MKKVLIPLLIFALPTNLLILAGGMDAARSQDPAIFVYRDELAAFSWLDKNAPADSLVMASPESGLLIPAYSSARVIYGHPFETIHAAEQLGEIYAFYSGGITPAQANNLLQLSGVDYVLYGPREKQIGILPEMHWQVLFTHGEIQILVLE